MVGVELALGRRHLLQLLLDRLNDEDDPALWAVALDHILAELEKKVDQGFKDLNDKIDKNVKDLNAKIDAITPSRSR